MESTSAGLGPAAPASAGPQTGLRRNAIGYLSNIVIGVASTAPAYSLAATLGFVVAVAGVGLHAPAVLIVSFIPMLLIAFAYRYLNRADPDAGTTFAWVTRAIGPRLGWLNGWVIVMADIIVMATLAQIAGKYTFLLFGWTSAANSNGAQIAMAVVWIALMTWVCYRGIGAVGPHVAGAAVRRDPHPRRLRRRRVREGLRPHGRPECADAAPHLVQPVRHELGALVDGLRRHEAAGEQLRRRPERPRHRRLRVAVEQAAGPRGADLVGRLDADHDPAHGAHDVLDGAPEGPVAGLRPDPPALPHAGLLDAVDGGRLSRLDGARRASCHSPAR
jgi:hypothetical protein